MLVYVAPVRYTSFTQRSHRMVAWFNERTGGRALWIDPYPGRLPRLSDLKRPRGQVHQRNDIQGQVTVLSPPQWAPDPLLAASRAGPLIWRATLARVSALVQGRSWLLLIGRPSLLALHLLRNAAPCLSVYDAMDDFPEFYAGFARSLCRRIERRVASEVSDVLVSSSALRQKFQRMGVPSIELLRNGLDGEWPQTRDARGRQIVFGYVGTIGPWFDWALVNEMAVNLPEVRFEIVGPVMTPPPASLPGNVHLAGECAHQDVPRKLLGFTAGLVPFKVSRLTEAVDPIKYYEYRAAGLPVLSTAFGEMRSRTAEPGVHLIRRGMDFPDLLGWLGARTPDTSGELARFRQENAWSSRFEQSRFLSHQALAAVRQCELPAKGA